MSYLRKHFKVNFFPYEILKMKLEKVHRKLKDFTVCNSLYISIVFSSVQKVPLEMVLHTVRLELSPGLYL